MTAMNMLITVALALIASAGFWATMQLIITRKGRTAEAARQSAEAEKLKQDAATGAVEKRKLIDEIETAAVARIHKDYDIQRGVIVTLVDVLETLVFRMRSASNSDDQIVLVVSNEEYLACRAALNEARKKLR